MHHASSLDYMQGKILIGHDNGRICTTDIEGNNMVTHNYSHCDGESWGLEVIPQHGTFLTCGDDNQFLEISIRDRKVLRSGKIWTKEMNNDKPYETKKIRSTASTLCDFPAHQQGRCITYSSKHNHVAVSNNQGDIAIFDYNDFSKRLTTLWAPREWCETMSYSPDGKYFAAGGHDDTIYIFEISVDGQYTMYHKVEYVHSSAITAMDWSKDSRYLRAIDQAYSKQFYDMTIKGQADDGCCNLTDPSIWATSTCKLGWEVMGIFPIGFDGTDVNSCDANADRSLIAVSDDRGSLNVYKFPCVRNTQDCRRIGGHSEHVTRVRFYENPNDKENECIITSGGMDRTYIQWKAIPVVIEEY